MFKFIPPNRSRSRLIVPVTIAFMALIVLTLWMFPPREVQAVSSTIVISQVYGGGGNSGSTFKNDFIEIFNRGNSSVSLSGWSVQYASTTGTSWQKTDLTAVTLSPGQYYLIQESAGGGGTVNLPAPDATGTISMAAGAGKVALVNNQTLIASGTSCPSGASIIDFVGYGTGTNCFEGSGPTATISASASASRAGSGCTDTDNNAADFTAGAVNPRNTSSTLHPCAPPNQAIIPTCPGSVSTVQGTATSAGLSATDPDGTVTSATITTPVAGISLSAFTPAGSVGGTASATLDVANTTAGGTYNVVIQWANNDSPTPQTATCTVVVTVTPPNQPIAPSCPGSLTASSGSAGSTGVSATDPDGTVTSASITSAPVTGITLDSFSAAGGTGGTATATLNVANTTAVGTYNVTIQWANNDSPTPQTATCTVIVTVTPPPGSVVISQVYGGGGNSGATLKNDFIELINHTNTPIDLTGWSVQYISATATSGLWQVTPLNGFVLQPGQYYLIQEAAGAGGTVNLPAPDTTGSIAMALGAGKVALVTNTTALSGAGCPSGTSIIDLVGYGSTANCFEGSGPAPTLTNTTAALRGNNGCIDTDNNASDFTAGTPNPRNSSTAFHDCTILSGVGSANPSTVQPGDTTMLTVEVSPAPNPPSTGINVFADLSSIGGSPSQMFSGSGNTFTYLATVSIGTAAGMKSLPVTITDAQNRSFNTNIVLSVQPLTPANHITISQLYGGGGNSGATYQNDYVELYNPTNATVTITGWSLQYSSATGTTWTNKQPLGGYIEPGQYYLVALGSGGSDGASLPTPNISGDINMSGTAGKLALVSNSDSLTGGCPLGSDPDIVDFVGYGTTANCHEGNANTPAPSNTTAIFRRGNGATDNDQNGEDFITGTPNPRRTAPIVELGPWVANTDPITNGFNVPYDDTISIDFSEPVSVDVGWYDINCSASGAHNVATVATYNGDKGYHITPNPPNFTFGEQCTVTVFKNKVHDEDLDDSGPDTDTLLENYVWSFTVVGAGDPAPYPPSVHLTMGNPSNATSSLSNPNNFLMEKPTYSVSYNRDKGTPNWVSWHLDQSWFGSLARVDTFRADPQVDPSWYRVQSTDYFSSGFDRGHMTPNADRDNENRIPINQETYLMTNMVPQAPDNNQGPWANFENYLRSILPDTGSGEKELYIVSGPQGIGGSGSNGGTTTTLANGHITVPAYTWKVVLVLPKGENDISRVDCSTRTIAVLMPNTQGIRSNPNNPNDWQNFLTTVDAVEGLTGYDFFSNLPPAVQACIEAGTNGSNPPGTANQTAGTAEDSPVTITLQGLRPDQNTLTFSVVDNPLHGSLGSVGAASCSGGSCTATVSYTPGSDYNGADSFTFKASDGGTDSNTSTVSINITEVNDPVVANDDLATATEDTPLNISAASLTTNDSAGPANESSQTMNVTSVTATANTHGSVMLSSGTISYSPDANYNGPASFEYQVCDNGTTNGSSDPKCATASVNVTVNPVNDLPTANSQSVSTSFNTPLPITLTGSDVETPSANLIYIVTAGPSHGSLSGTGANRTYTPANYSGPDSFKFTVTDAGDGSSPPLTSSEATVSITVDCPVLSALGSASVWLGLKNSDDVGTKFDLLAEVLKNGVVVGSGPLNDVPGGGSGFNNAVQRAISQSLSGPQSLCPGDTMSIRLSGRIAASSGHASGTARLWFNDAAANSRFTATVGGVTSDYYLRNGFTLATTAGPGPKSTIDVTVNRNQNGNAFKPFGTWTITF